MYDLIIRNGTIVDGTGADARQGDVAVENGKIVAVGEDLWEKVLKEISGEAILSALKIEAPPEDPLVN